MRTDLPWLIDTVLLVTPERGWTTLPEILKRLSPLGIAQSNAKYIWWKIRVVFRWTERRAIAGASPGRRPNGHAMKGQNTRTGLKHAFWEYRLTAAGRDERR